MKRQEQKERNQLEKPRASCKELQSNRGNNSNACQTRDAGERRIKYCRNTFMFTDSTLISLWIGNFTTYIQDRQILKGKVIQSDHLIERQGECL